MGVVDLIEQESSETKEKGIKEEVKQVDFSDKM